MSAFPWVRCVLRTYGDPRRHGQRPCRLGLDLGEPVAQSLGESHRAAEIAGGKDHRELLAADPAHDIRRAHRAAQQVRDLEQQLVPDPVPVDVVHLLEVVEVEHHERNGVVLH
jgi:hypothetical protein